jgi:tetratricopeptide (TPR) repeat protein
VSGATETSELERLQGLLGSDPAAAAFPALAETHRRAGEPGQAEEIARAGLERRPDALAGRVALGLALLDQGRLDEARAEMERVLASVPDHPVALEGLAASAGDVARPWESFAPGPPEPDVLAGPIDGPEIDAAFEQATPERDEMVSADSVAAQAIHSIEHEVLHEVGSDEGGIPVSTHTVAGLLDEQGHARDAAAMRQDLDARALADRERILGTLERWLGNIQRNRA